MVITIDGKNYKIYIQRVEGCFGSDCGFDAWLVNENDETDRMHMNSVSSEVRQMITYYAKCGI